MTGRWWVATILVTACLQREADAPLPPEALAAPAAKVDAVVLERAAQVDPNRGPITIWAVRRDRGLEALYFIGHAETACCKAISQLEHSLDDDAFADAWYTYGFGEMHAGTRKEAALALERGLARARDLTAAGAVCAGQAHVYETDVDPFERGQKLAEAGKAALARARAEQRPVVAYFRGDERPTVAPVFTDGGDGALRPVRFAVPRSSLDVPQSLVMSLRLGEYGDEIDEIGDRVLDLQLVQGLLTTREPLTALARLGPMDVERTAFGARLKERIDEDLKRLRTIEYERRQLCALATEAAPVLASAAAWQQHACVTLRAEVAGLNAGLQASQKNIDLEGNASTAYAWKVHRDVEPDQRFEIAYRQMLDAVDPQALAAREQQLRGAMRRLEAAGRARPVNYDTALGIMVDAVLRGWPAQFGNESQAHNFDAWAARSQKPLWAGVTAQLAARGVTLPGAVGEGNPLLQSSLLFRVEPTRSDAYTITPIQVFSGDFYVVADPVANLVRFEAINADQNLRL